MIEDSKERLSSYCPQCKNENLCCQVSLTAIQDSSSNYNPCWCMDIKLNADIVHDIQKSGDMKSCLCKKCLSAFSLEDNKTK